MPPIPIGAATVSCVQEHQFTGHIGLFTDDEALIRTSTAGLPPDLLDPATGSYVFSNHSWVLHVDGLTVLLDPCTGNSRTGLGPAFGAFENLRTPYLETLTAAGAAPDSVDVVVSTHLHFDHCGWNTVPVGDTWVPTFPWAQYVFHEIELARWDDGARPAPRGAPSRATSSHQASSSRPSAR